MKFRKLRADEIDARIGMCKEKGLTLLLYKDARADMNILDEAVGCFNWKREHEIIGGNLYCTVSVYCEERGEWVSKQDVGTESNTEKEKGQASDSFKRACVNFGIGRELYTSPFIWVSNANIYCVQQGGKPIYKSNDKFKVEEISYTEEGVIKDLTIKNLSNGTVAFTTNKNSKSDPKPQQQNNPVATNKLESPSTGINKCECCCEKVKDNVANFSKSKYGRVLCFKCQKNQ